VKASIHFLENIDLSKFSSWKVGGKAAYFFQPQTLVELVQAQKQAQQENLRMTILGGGSNVLISDAGVSGLVLNLSKLAGIEILDEMEFLEFWALSGTRKSSVLKLFLQHKLCAALFLAGIPGQISGGVVMNAGVSEKILPCDFSGITEGVEVLRPDGTLDYIRRDKLNWDYRHCEGWRPGIITRVRIKVPLKKDDLIPEKVKASNQMRLQKQPLEWPSCGSVFRNPLPLHAAKLIELSGLKGRREGNAQISNKHSNFIVNLGGAKTSEIKSLIDLCISEVQKHHGVLLKTEVVFLGDF
jgi:UDP-N-acetylmuramate dehydrogenase